ncbi:MAG: 50S ribosomal protein L9 [Verrucomicrobia bacterium]|nr:50S ribosomal protein L9 [Verrucomicrobiota bacterium]MBS0637127.1 50S ribosomal protein L9 [Verrucomicrobiota bacterium]
MPTQILLLDDVDNVGHKGEIVTVKPGYAFNFLIPKKFALVADRNAVRRQKRLQEERRVKAAEDKKAAEEVAARLNGTAFTIEVKVDHDGHMYGSVSSLDIVHLVKSQSGIELDKRSVPLKHPIKQTGVHDLTLRLKEGVEALIHLKVLVEGAVEHEEPVVADEAQQ